MMRFGRILGIFLILLGLAAPAAGANPTGESLVQLRDVTVEPREGTFAVQLHTTGQVRYQHALIDTPYRVVIDLEGTQYGWRKTPLTVDSDPLRQIRGSQYRKGVTRVVLQLSRKAGYQVAEGPDGLTVTFGPAPAAETVQDARKTEAAKAKATAKTVVRRAGTPEPMKSDLMKREPNPSKQALVEAQTAVTVTGELAADTPMQGRPGPAEPKKGAIRVAQAQSSQAPAAAPGQRLISFDFKDADIVNIFRILAAESGKNIVVGDDVKGKISLALKNVTWDLAMEIILEARGLEKIEKDNVIRIVSTEQLAKERDAKAKAEEAKLKADADIRTKIAEAQLKEQEAQQKKLNAEAARTEAQARGPLKEELIRLAYRDPDEVVKTLTGLLGIAPEGAVAAPAAPPPILEQPFSQLYGVAPALTPPPAKPTVSSEVLAKGITIRADKPTNSVFIRHYEADLERIKKLIREKLDVPLPQVKIEARLNDLSRTDLFEVGIQWGGAGVRSDGRNVLIGQGFATKNTGGIAPTLFGGSGRTSTNPNATLTGLLPVSATTGLPTGGNIVNLPTGGTDIGALSFGIIGTKLNLNLILQALETQKKARSLSRPEIVTVENAKATISLGSEIPYSTVSSAGTQVQFKDAVLKLEVTPTPTVIREPDVTKIKMKVIVTDDSKGLDVSAGTGFIPSINKRRVETEVIVKEGETLVVGGITQRTEAEIIRKVPLLGDIPLLGWLFKARQTKVDPNRELVVFITPSVLKTDQQPKPVSLNR